MSNNESHGENELIVKVKPGTKVRVVEATPNDEDLKTRDLHVLLCLENPL